MCECGCTSGNQVFKLKAPKGWYIIEFLRGCDYCSVGPGIQIHHPEAIDPMYFGFDNTEDMESIPDLPILGKGEHCVTMIKCGLDPGEVQKAAVRCFVGRELELNPIDTISAEIMGEEFWEEALIESPSVIYPTEVEPE